MTDPATNPAVIEVTGEITALDARFASYEITTRAQFEAGAEDLKRVKAAQKKLEETRTGITNPMNAALKKVNDFFRDPALKLTEIERGIKAALNKFVEAEQARAREEQRKADEAAAAERRKAEAAAAEAKRKAEEEAAELRRKAEAAAAAGRQAEADKLTQRADTKIERADEKAEVLQQQARTAVAPVISRAPPKVAGVQMREVWDFDISDPLKVPREYLMVDETKIRKVVQALKGDTKIAGVRVFPKNQIAAGGR